MKCLYLLNPGRAAIKSAALTFRCLDDQKSQPGDVHGWGPRAHGSPEPGKHEFGNSKRSWHYISGNSACQSVLQDFKIKDSLEKIFFPRYLYYLFLHQTGEISIKIHSLLGLLSERDKELNELVSWQEHCLVRRYPIATHGAGRYRIHEKPGGIWCLRCSQHAAGAFPMLQSLFGLAPSPCSKC